MKPKRKLKNGYRVSNKRFLVVAIGLLVILTLAVANIVYMANYRLSGDARTATSMRTATDGVRAMTRTQAAMPISTVESP